MELKAYLRQRLYLWECSREVPSTYSITVDNNIIYEPHYNWLEENSFELYSQRSELVCEQVFICRLIFSLHSFTSIHAEVAPSFSSSSSPTEDSLFMASTVWWTEYPLDDKVDHFPMGLDLSVSYCESLKVPGYLTILFVHYSETWI